MQINKKQFNKWIVALRSGKYQQTKCKLQDEDGYCCLGVACKVLSKNYKKQKNGMLSGKLPSKSLGAQKWVVNINYDFDSKTGKPLVTLNDIFRFNFDEIADLLEAVYIHKVLE